MVHIHQMKNQYTLGQSVSWSYLNIFHIDDLSNDVFHHCNRYHICYIHHDVHDEDRHGMLPIGA